MTVTKNETIGKHVTSECTPATLDEAMLQTGFGVYNILHMLLNGAILLGVIMQNLVLGYVLPAAQCDLELTSQQQGLLAAIPFMATILTSYFWGWLGDTRGRRPVMLYSMMTSVVFSVITSFAPNLISFAVLQFMTSIFDFLQAYLTDFHYDGFLMYLLVKSITISIFMCLLPSTFYDSIQDSQYHFSASGSTAIVYTYLGEFNNLRHRDKMVAFGSSFVGIGTVVLPAVSWLILPLNFTHPLGLLNIVYRPWRLLIVACALPYTFAATFLFFSPESPKFLNAKGRQDACLEVLKTIYAINKRRPANDFPVKSLISDAQTSNTDDKKREGIAAVLSSMKEQTLPLFKMPLVPWIGLACFVQFGIFAATNGFYVWFPTILNSLATHDGKETGICAVLEASRAQQAANRTVIKCDDSLNTSTFERSIYIGLFFSSMYIIVGFLVDFVGKKVILVVSLMTTGVCGIGAHLAQNQQAAVILFAVFQMSGACIGLMNAVAVELFPTKYRAMAICLAMMMGRMGSMVGSNVLGLLLNTNCAVSFYLFGGIIVMNGLVCLLLPGKKHSEDMKPKTVEPTECDSQQPV